MGLCQSSEKESQEHQRSNEIDKLIEKEKINKEKEYKILLLGKHFFCFKTESLTFFRQWRVW